MDAATLNSMNRSFWAHQSAELERCLADPLLKAKIIFEVRSDQFRLQPRDQRTMESIADSESAFMHDLWL